MRLIESAKVPSRLEIANDFGNLILEILLLCVCQPTQRRSE